ncbi:uncharacterized protein LOC114300011 isoform X8 [Camellia sinensis]|uniref:uncharacterized protein LOC114300011 isoform X8 n=1 Tax=Camellia sinensis TaxID=4442 RepID=UPI001035E8D1|nr:uncharacterized protein LOC114300011 isoform X8 [Camellia sinensis]
MVLVRAVVSMKDEEEELTVWIEMDIKIWRRKSNLGNRRIEITGLDLKCLNLWEHPFMEVSGQTIQDKNEAALTDEILDVLKLVLEVHELPLAQI